MKEEICEKFAKYLLPGEEVIWCGRPGLGLRLRWMDLFLIPFGLLWCGFLYFGKVFPSFEILKLFDSLVYIFMWIAGIFILMGRYILDAYIRSTHYYAVTNQRSLIFNGKRLAEYYHPENRDILLRRSGTIDLVFKQIPKLPKFGERADTMHFYCPSISMNSFEYLENGKEVFSILKSAHSNAK